MRGMDAVMLNCDKALCYNTKNELGKLGFFRKIQLRMHLAGCEFCRNFARQSELITRETAKLKEIDPDHLAIHLTEIQKEHLRETVDSQLEH